MFTESLYKLERKSYQEIEKSFTLLLTVKLYNIEKNVENLF